tara:strand:+ start:2850 stop:3179 length:330 start_codon:yes stop_codon:yes gene_type:complete
MLDDTKIEEKVIVEDYLKTIKKYTKGMIECAEHTFFRLSEKQGKIFTCEELKKVLLTEKPFLAGIQYNKNYAVFYEYKNKNLKIILNIKDRKINIVTFYFIKEWQIPTI